MIGIWRYLVLFVVLYIVMGTLFFFTEMPNPNLSYGEAIYFAVGALGGNTYGDVLPTTPASRLLGGIMTLATVFLLALVIAGFGRRAEDVARSDALGMLGTTFTDHYVVLGSDPVAKVACRELLRQEFQVAMLIEREEEVERLRPLAPPEQLFLTYGPSDEVETLNRLNLARCRGAIISMEDDAANAILALHVRTHFPQTRLIVSANRPELRSTIRTAGVTFVASPLEMGGRICASAAFEPDIASALDELTTIRIGSDFREYVLPPGAPPVGRKFREVSAEMSARAEAVLTGYSRRDASGTFQTHLAPDGDDVLIEGDALLVIVRLERLQPLTAWIGAGQGR